MGKKSGPAAPTPPDPVATAAAQATLNREGAITQANLNRIDQYTPQGNIRYTQTGTNPDGTPMYRQDQTYSPDQQGLYDQANQVASALNGMAISNIGRVANTQSTEFNYDGATPLRTNIGGQGNIQQGVDFSSLGRLPTVDDFSADRDRVSNSVYEQAASRLNPRFEQGESDMRSRLAAQGISENSDAYRREGDNFGRTRNDAYNQAQFDAIRAGGDEQSRLFGMAMGARGQGAQEIMQQGAFSNQARAQSFNESSAEGAFNNSGRQTQIGEMSYLRNLPLNEIAALLGTGSPVQNPYFQPVPQVGVAAPDYMGAVNNNFNAATSQYNAAQANRSQGLGSIFGALGSAASAIPWSDSRLKTDIKRIGTLPSGIATYAFKYVWSKMQQFGVMAQEVLEITPIAVVVDPNGYMRVNYGKVY